MRPGQWNTGLPGLASAQSLPSSLLSQSVAAERPAPVVHAPAPQKQIFGEGNGKYIGRFKTYRDKPRVNCVFDSIPDEKQQPSQDQVPGA